MCARIHTIAEASGDRLMRLEAHHALWTTHFFRGELAAAFQNLETGEPLYDPTWRLAPAQGPAPYRR